MDELTDYTEDLANFIVEPSHTLISVDVQLGFSLGERSDTIESHPDWHELT